MNGGVALQAVPMSEKISNEHERAPQPTPLAGNGSGGAR